MTRATATLTLLACAIAPAIASAQALAAPVTAPPELPPLRFLPNEPPPSTGREITLTGVDLWKPPVSGSDLPRWTIERKATLNGPRGLTFSAGLSGRRGDPMPLYLSQPAFTQSLPECSITGPGSYRTQWDVTFGVSAPIATIGGVKLKAFGDVMLPVVPLDPATPGAPLLNSRTIRFGIKAIF